MCLLEAPAEPTRRRSLREQQTAPVIEPKPWSSLLDHVPPDTPMDEGITLGCWNGERFVSWEKWRAAIQIEPLTEQEQWTVEDLTHE